jgi:hypothetical protein
VRRIMQRVEAFSIGMVCLDMHGRTGRTSHGWIGSSFAACWGSPGGEPLCESVAALT